MRTRRYPQWLPPVAFVGALGIALLLSNQSAPLPNGQMPITTTAEYQDAMGKVEDLSQERIKAYDAGKPLSPDDLAKLREAGTLVDRMDAFAPLMSSLFFLSGKIHHILGEDSVAEERFRQCILGIGKQAEREPANTATLNATGAEAAYQLSQLLLVRRDFKGALDAANDAVGAVPESSNYLTARASALNELRRTDEAKKDLTAALLLDPHNSRAAGLLRLLSHP